MNKKLSLSSQAFLIHIICFCLICSLFASCRTTRAPGTAADTSGVPKDTRPCVANITVEGSAMIGRTFKTFQDFSDVTRAAAFDQIVQSLATGGWTIASSNKETGVITSWGQPRFSKGETESLNIVVRDKGAAGIRVEITYRAPAMAAVSKGTLHNAFCRIMEDAESAKKKSPDKPPPKPPEEFKPVPPQPEPKPSPPPQPPSRKTTVIVPSENLREGPGTNYKIIGKVNKGTSMAILEEKGSWLRVRLEDGTQAWIWKASTAEDSTKPSTPIKRGPGDPM